MGILLEPPGYNSACALCFPANETPDIIYVSITGVQYGSGWDSTLGPAPNGTHRLQHSAGCTWTTRLSGYDYDLIFGVGQSHFVVRRGSPPDKFNRSYAEACRTFFKNSITSSSAPFYGGQASITWTYPDMPGSVAQAASIVGYTDDDPVRYEFYPIENLVNVFRFASPTLPINYKLKIDNS